MRVFQILPSLNFGDAIGNYAIALKHIIEEIGLDTAIYTDSIHPKITESNTFELMRMPKIDENDIIIYHMADGNPLNLGVANIQCRKIMIYHNITPYEFLAIDSIPSSEICRKGLDDMIEMNGKFTSYLTVSEFNKSDMVRMGYNEKNISVIPIIVPFEDYKKEPDLGKIKELSDGMTNIVFVGRIAPNKKHEDLIRCFAYYKRNINQNSRLVLAGSANTGGMYFKDLKDYIEYLGVEDIIFPGHVSFPEILAIYAKADVFLCLSEHEGFCVPILEAMTFDVPIIAYNAAAVPETIGGSAVVVNDKDPAFLANVIDGVVNNTELRQKVIAAQRERLKYFSYGNIKKMFVDYLSDFIAKYPPINRDNPLDLPNRLYDAVENNMKSAGKSMNFTRAGLFQSISREPHKFDVSELLNQNYSTQETVECVYISVFNRLPDKEAVQHWENEACTVSREEFLKRLITSVMGKSDVEFLTNPYGGALQ